MMMTPEPLSIENDASGDYALVRAVIGRISTSEPGAFDLERFARENDMSERALVALFKRWCGLSPKSFAQAVALDHAQRLLKARESVLGTTLALGLSSSARLHDLFVTHHAMPPGAWRDAGQGLTMTLGAAPSPFGLAVGALTEWGLAGLGFADTEADLEQAFEDLRRRWPGARFTRDDQALRPVIDHIFSPDRWATDRRVRIVLIGTDFEVRVWEALLAVPLGQARRYGEIAAAIGRPSAARAVGAAVGRNPISFVVPCHRIVGAQGALTGYHWGVPRKRAMLGWEAGVLAGSAA